MKRFLISLIVVSMLGFNTIAFASVEGQAVQQTEGQTVDAGITPDSILYSADKLFEDLQLLLTTDSEKEAELLLKFAQERLAEAKVMTEEEKTEFVKTAMDAYIETLDQAEEKVTEVATDESTSDEVKDQLTQKLEDTANVDGSIQENLDTEQQGQLEEKTTEVSYTANVVKNIDVEVVKALREEGMGFGNIAHTVALAELSGKSVDEIAAMIKEGKGIGNIAKELGIHPSKMNNKAEVAEEDAASEETAGEEPAAGDTTTGEAAGESGGNTANGDPTAQAVSTLAGQDTTKQVQTVSKQTQTTSVKGADKEKDVKAIDAKKNEKSNENKEATSIQQETNTVTNNTSQKDNKNEVKNTKANSENGNSGKSNKGSKR